MFYKNMSTVYFLIWVKIVSFITKVMKSNTRNSFKNFCYFLFLIVLEIS